MSRVQWGIALGVGLGLSLAAGLAGSRRATGGDQDAKSPTTPLKAVASTESGLLLEPPVDLARWTRREFEAAIATVGADRINRPWASAVTPLPPLPGHQPDQARTEPEIKQVMLQLRDLFDQGKAAPVSDIGLISTQEDIVRKPMFNHVAAFSNSALHAYLLVQRDAASERWGYFAIVRDNQADPPTDYFAELDGPKVRFEGNYCYKCHSSGPLAVHPVREDLVNDVALLRGINRQIADEPPARFHFPPPEPPVSPGAPLQLAACTECHAAEGSRGPLFRLQAHPIRVLVDFGFMPPGRRLNPQELADLRAWLDTKP